VATYTRFESLGAPVSTAERADAVRDLEHASRRTRWATVLESGFVAGTRQAAAGALAVDELEDRTPVAPAVHRADGQVEVAHEIAILTLYNVTMQ